MWACRQHQGARKTEEVTKKQGETKIEEKLESRKISCSPKRPILIQKRPLAHFVRILNREYWPISDSLWEWFFAQSTRIANFYFNSFSTFGIWPATKQRPLPVPLDLFLRIGNFDCLSLLLLLPSKTLSHAEPAGNSVAERFVFWGNINQRTVSNRMIIRIIGVSEQTRKTAQPWCWSF